MCLFFFFILALLFLSADKAPSDSPGNIIPIRSRKPKVFLYNTKGKGTDTENSSFHRPYLLVKLGSYPFADVIVRVHLTR